MESRIVVTYKRKRLFSRSDHSNINLHSDTPSEITESKTQAIVNKEKESEIRHEHVNDKNGENLAHCGNCTSQCSSQCSERATIRHKLSSGCTNQQDSSNSQKITFNSKVLLEGSQSHAEEKSTDNRSQLPLSVNSGSEHEDKSKETFSNKFHKDQDSNLNTEKPKSGPTLITFCRKSKRKREIANLVNPVIGNKEKDSREKISSLQGEACVDVQDINNVNQLDVGSQSLSNEDRNTKRTPNKKNSQPSLDLSTPPPAARDIDCNLPLDCGSDEDHRPVPVPSEVVHNSLGSTSKTKEKIPNLQLQSSENGYPVGPVVDKGKSPMNNYLQLFPGNKSNQAPQLANDLQKAALFAGPQESGTHLNPPSVQSARFHGLPMAHNLYPYYPSSYPWPNINVQPREAFQYHLHSTTTSQPFSRYNKMMLENMLNRNTYYYDKFESHPLTTTWTEEELDCLWVGVRRHGKGNWDAILRDRKLNFLPWKTTRDLAERWQEEQYKLVYGVPVMNIQTNGHLQNPVMNRGPVLSPYGHFGKFSWGPSESNIIARGETSSDVCGMKGNLPHWLREAVEVPPGQRVVSSFCRKKDELIVIPSDSSSEETISDDFGVRL